MNTTLTLVKSHHEFSVFRILRIIRVSLKRFAKYLEKSNRDAAEIERRVTLAREEHWNRHWNYRRNDL